MKTEGSSHVYGTDGDADILQSEPVGSFLHLGPDGVWKDSTSWNAGDPANNGTGTIFNLAGYEQNFDVFRGSDGVVDTLVMGNGHRAFIFDDTIAPSAEAGPRLASVEVIKGGDGGQLIDITSRAYSYGDIVIYGGSGDDIILANLGNDLVKGGKGNDYVWGGSGNDTVMGTGGDDQTYGGAGNDVVQGGSASILLAAASATTRCRAATTPTGCGAAPDRTPSPSPRAT
jgi:Ca2+-binding RTX toxin-like protein